MGRRKISKGPELTNRGLIQGASVKASFAAKHLPTFVRAANFVKAKFFSARSGPVTAKAFVIQQGVELGLTRPLSFAPNGFYIEDLGFFLSAGQRQDMGALFTQRQINESHDLKCALVSGDLVAEWGNSADTVPIADSVTVNTTVTVNPLSDLLFATEVRTIGAVIPNDFTNYADPRTEIFDVSNWKRKTFVLVNTGTADILVRAWASVDGSAYPIPLLTEATVTPGGTVMVDEEMAFKKFKFEVKRTGGLDSQVTTYGYAYRI